MREKTWVAEWVEKETLSSFCNGRQFCATECAFLLYLLVCSNKIIISLPLLSLFHEIYFTVFLKQISALERLGIPTCPERG